MRVQARISAKGMIAGGTVWILMVILLSLVTPMRSQRALAVSPVYVAVQAINDPAPNDWSRSDLQENGSWEHPYDELQEAIDLAIPGDEIIVIPGQHTFRDDMLHVDKDITIRNLDPNVIRFAELTHLRGTIRFSGNETPNCVLDGFSFVGLKQGAIRTVYGRTRATIRNCIFIGNGPCSGTIIKRFDGVLENCLIADNIYFGTDCGPPLLVNECGAHFRNCTIVNNLTGLYLDGGSIENCIIVGNQGEHQLATTLHGQVFLSYSNVQGWADLQDLEGIVGGEGMMDQDPNFVQNGVWDTEDSNALIPGDYHLKSEGWRWMMWDMEWTRDDRTSPCIDSGNPETPLGNEAYSDDRTEMIYVKEIEGGWNLAVNMGFYGGTQEASVLEEGHEPNSPKKEDPNAITGVLSPDPPQWASSFAGNPSGAPRAVLVDESGGIWSGYGVTMAVAEVNNSSGNPVYYMFDCDALDENLDSGWSTGRSYTKLIGAKATTKRLSYRVKAKDNAGNETQWSPWADVIY